MSKNAKDLLWKSIYSICLTVLASSIMNQLDLLQFGSPIERGVLLVITLITSGVIVQVVWEYIEKHKSKSRIFFNKLLGFYYSRQTTYSWQVKPNELNLCFEKHPNINGLKLSLLLSDIRLIGGTDLQKQAIDKAKLFSVKKKTLFYKETPLINKDVVSIVKKENGTLVFFIPENTELIAPFQGKYIYVFYELWESKGNYYYGKSVAKNIVINNKGQIDSEEM